MPERASPTAPRPWLPADISLPFFAYGLFRPGQLAYFQIRDLATATPASVAGALRIRDGVPFLDPSLPGSVSGALIRFPTDDAEVGYRRISAMEPKDLYSWQTLTIDDGVTANVLVGRSPEKGNPLDWPDWDGWKDPLFVEGLELIEAKAHSVRKQHGYRALFMRQMAYMLLWSAIERYLSLRYRLGGNVHQKVLMLAADPNFASALSRHVSERREVRRSDDPGETERLNPDNPKASAVYYYQVRSNVTHRGKTGPDKDSEILQKALDELLPIFRDVLRATENDAQHHL